MTNLDAIIVGGGLFGQIIAKALRAQGRTVCVVDAGKEGAGSRPAACLMKPSWFSSLGRDVYEPSLQLLDELYGVQDIRFKLHPFKVGGKVGEANVHWIPPASILDEPFSHGVVEHIDAPHVHTRRDILTAPLIVVAAGYWTERLLPQYRQQGQKGVAFLWRDGRINNPFIYPWAPYRQLVAFNRGDGLWASDGTAIKEQNWTREREETSMERCERALKPQRMEPELLVGIRPYARGHKPCLLQEVQPGLWVASGGAKNGTLAAGYCAHRIVEATS